MIYLQVKGNDPVCSGQILTVKLTRKVFSEDLLSGSCLLLVLLLMTSLAASQLLSARPS
jgi:hypothetical protein